MHRSSSRTRPLTSDGRSAGSFTTCFTRTSVAAAPAVAAMLACAPLASCDHATGPRQATVRQRWYATQPGHSQSRPAIAGDVVYVGTGDGQVVARDRRSGAARWATYVSGGPVDGANLVARGGVVVAVATYETVGLDAATGAQLWRFAAPPDPGVSVGPGGLVQGVRLDADDATVYVPAWGASVSAVDLRTGRARWSWTPGVAPTDTAAAGGPFRSGAEGVRVSGDTVFAGVWHNVDRLGYRSEEWIVALDRATGAELWRVSLPVYTSAVAVDGAPALAGNLVLLGTIGGHVWAVDRTSRQLVWHFATTPHLATISEPEVADGVVYRDGGDAQLYAIRASDGTVLWKSAAVGQVGNDVLVTAGRVYATNSVQLFVLDRRSGRLVATVNQPHPPARTGGVISAPAAAEGGQVVSVMTGGVLSFDEP
ncbi:MAG: PQQ-binding-like beta-propeller repeat protein [Gemmatimonadaceae bacterium]